MFDAASATHQPASAAKLIADRVVHGESVALDVLRIAVANILPVLCAQIVIPLPFNTTVRARYGF
jgi:hypothetical protein